MKDKKDKMKKQVNLKVVEKQTKGITLIALVVTIALNC